jgi:hypothetical protein
MNLRHHVMILPALSAFLAATTVNPAAAKLACDGLTAEGLGLQGVTLVRTEALPQGEGSPVPHCRIEATTAERTGVDGKPYAVKFEIRLPDDWNGGFVHQFNGGNDGEVKPALGPLLGGNQQRTALGRG